MTKNSPDERIFQRLTRLMPAAREEVLARAFAEVDDWKARDALNACVRGARKDRVTPPAPLPVTEKMSLRDLCRKLKYSQKLVAARGGITQSGGMFEGRNDDTMISTLYRHARGMGLALELIVHRPGKPDVLLQGPALPFEDGVQIRRGRRRNMISRQPERKLKAHMQGLSPFAFANIMARIGEIVDLKEEIQDARMIQRKSGRKRKSLRDLRKQAKMTLAAVAARLGVSRAAVCVAESRDDGLYSRFHRHVAALGASLQPVVRFPDGTGVEITGLTRSFAGAGRLRGNQHCKKASAPLPAPALVA